MNAIYFFIMISDVYRCLFCLFQPKTAEVGGTTGRRDFSSTMYVVKAAPLLTLLLQHRSTNQAPRYSKQRACVCFHTKQGPCYPSTSDIEQIHCPRRFLALPPHVQRSDTVRSHNKSSARAVTNY